MVRRSLLTALLVSGTALADFSYQQTSRVTGGAMAGMMKVAGAFSSKARQPMVTSVLLKGDRMAHVSADHITVIDLAKETFTSIDVEKKTYSVMTFAEMAEAMRKAAEKMKDAKQGNSGEINFRADVKQTGQRKQISGLDTKQYLVTLTMEGTDAKTGQTGGMDMQMDMWVAPDIAGYEEVRAFYHRMAEKVSWSPFSSMAGALANQYPKGMAELVKQMSKLEGVPVYQITRLGVNGQGVNGAAMPTEAEMQAAQQQQEQAKAEADSNRRDAMAAQGIGAAIGGRAGAIASLGGFGGFGRKKKSTEQQQQQQQTAKADPAPAPRPQATPAAPAGPASLMELTTESSNFSSASVDSSKFEVPAGFKQVESDIRKMR